MMEPPIPRIPDHQLLRKIGSGAYGEVWLVRNVLGTFRAAKVIYRSSFEDRRPYEREFAGIRRFEPLARKHPGHVEILHVGRNADPDYFYYVMELADDVSGVSAADSPESYTPKTLASERKARGTLPIEDCIRIGLALADGLAHLHANGLIHRDVKPSNVIFVGGVAKLADIGLVTELDRTLSFVGTEGYIAPEGPTSTQSDIYSLGKLLYEIATGLDRREFPRLPDELETWPDHDRFVEFNEVILKATETEARRRYPSASALQDDLRLVAAGRSLVRARLVETRLRHATRFGAASMFLALIAGIAFFYQSGVNRKMAELVTDRSLTLARIGRLSQTQGRVFNGISNIDEVRSLRVNKDPETRRRLVREAVACLSMFDILPDNNEPSFPEDTIASAYTSDGAARAWSDAAGNIYHSNHSDGSQHQLIAIVDSPPTRIDFADHDRRLVTWRDHQLNVYNIETREELGEWSRPTPRFGYSILPNDQGLAFAENDGVRLRFWDPARASVNYRTSLSTEGRPFSPDWVLAQKDGDLIFLGRSDRYDFDIVNTKSGQSLRTPENFLAFTSRPLRVAWRPQTQEFSVLCSNGSIATWDASIGAEVANQADDSRLGNATELLYSEDGRILLVYNANNGQFDLFESNRLVSRLTFQAQPGLQDFQYGSQNRIMGRNASNGQVSVWSLRPSPICRILGSNSPIASFGGGMLGADSSGQWLLIADNTRTEIWELDTSRRVARFPTPGAKSIALHPRKPFLVQINDLGAQRLTLGPSRSLGASTWTLGWPSILHVGYSPSHISFARDSDRYAISQPGTISIFSVDDFAPLQDPSEPARSIETTTDEAPFIAMHPEGNRIALYHPGASKLQILNIDGEVIASISGPNECRQIDYAPTGDSLLVVTPSSISLWNGDDLRFQRQLPTPDQNADTAVLAVSPSQRYYAVVDATDRYSAQIRDWTTGDVLAELEHPLQTDIHQAVFVRDATLVTFNRQGLAFVWELHKVAQSLQTRHLADPFYNSIQSDTQRTNPPTLTVDPIRLERFETLLEAQAKVRQYELDGMSPNAQITPNDAPNIQQHLTGLSQYASALKRAGRLDDAIRVYETILKSDPDHIWANIGWAMAHRHSQDIETRDQAKSRLRHAIAQRDTLDTRFMLALFLSAENDTLGVRETLAKCLAPDTTKPASSNAWIAGAYFLNSWSHAQDGDAVSASENYNQGLKHSEDGDNIHWSILEWTQSLQIAAKDAIERKHNPNSRQPTNN